MFCAYAEVGVAYLNALGEAISKRRINLGLTQDEVAQAAGIHRTYLSSIERGERNITLTVLTKLAVALNTEAYRLLREAERKCRRGA